MPGSYSTEGSNDSIKLARKPVARHEPSPPPSPGEKPLPDPPSADDSAAEVAALLSEEKVANSNQDLHELVYNNNSPLSRQPELESTAPGEDGSMEPNVPKEKPLLPTVEEPGQGKQSAKVKRRPVGSTDFAGASPVKSRSELLDMGVSEAGRLEQESVRPQPLAVPHLVVPAQQQRPTGRRSPRQDMSRRSPDHFQHPAAAQPIPRQNPPTARLANRNSIQFPANGFYYETTKFRPLNPNASTASFSRRRPLSYMSTSSKGGLDWRQGGPAPTPRTRKPVSEAPSAGSVATGVPVFGSRRPVAAGPESDQQWRYHVLKTAGPATPDLVLTTNPDAEHVRCHVAPAYCVSVVVQGAPTSQGQLGFTMTVIDPRKHICAVTVTRFFAAATEEELYEVVVYDTKPEARGRGAAFAEFDFGQPSTTGSSVVTDEDDELSGDEMVRLTRQIMSIQGQVPAVAGRREAWRALARARPAAGFDDASKLATPGKKAAGRQFEFQDDRGRRWVVGNRVEGSDGSSSGGDSDEADENDAEHTRPTRWSAAGKKKSSLQRTVHCFIPGDSGPASDLHMARLDRLKPSKSQTHLTFDDNDRDDPAASAAASNYGTLTMHAHVKKRPGMWAVAAALTLAVSYGQGLDVREESSVGEKLRRFGRMYKEGRKQVYYGHWHTQSLG